MEGSLRSKLDGSWCPFAWKFIYSLEDDAIATEDDISVIGFVHLLLNCYRQAADAGDRKSAREYLARAKSKLEGIRNEDHFRPGVRAYEHVYHATEGHLLLEPDGPDDRKRIDDVIENLHDVSTFDDRETGALHGCKAIALSFLYEREINNCIAEAREAIRLDPGNAIWKFVLAKTLRHHRRFNSTGFRNDDEERENFRIAYKKYPHPCTAVFYAQALVEKYPAREFLARPDLKEHVTKIYGHIISKELRNYNTLLKIVIGSIRIKEYAIARECLEKAEEMVPNHATVIHYKGELARAEGRAEEALQYFLEAGMMGNLSADLAYTSFIQKYKRESPRPHLLNMLQRYDEPKRQKILLYIADTYYNRYQKDYANAARYFIDAIKCDPKSRILNAKFTHINSTCYRDGIYEFIRNKFCPAMQRTRRSPELDKLYEELRQLVLDNM